MLAVFMVPVGKDFIELNLMIICFCRKFPSSPLKRNRLRDILVEIKNLSWTL